jgi:long-chain acyl-CoA synthetase
MAEPFWEKSYPKGVRWAFNAAPRALPELLDEAAKKWSGRAFVDFMGCKLDFSDVHDLADRAAKGFQAMGVGKGVKVGLFLPNVPHYVIAFYGVLKAGGTVVNYSPLDAERELEHKIADSETDFIVTLDLVALYPRIAAVALRSRVKKLIVGRLQDYLPTPKNLLFPLLRRKEIADVPVDDRHVRWKELIANDGRFAPVHPGNLAEELAVLQYTGGTTGVPKGAMLTHANLSAAVEQVRQWTSGDPPLLEDGKESVLTILPLFHIYAMTVVMLAGTRMGATLILHPRFDAEAVLKDLARKRPTMLPGVPTMFTALLNHPKSASVDMTSLKYCGSGGAPLPPEVQARFVAKTGTQLVEGWGMTETSPTGTATPKGGYRPGSAGVPLPGCLIEFVDVNDPLKLLPYGQTGEICISGPNLMKGYWKRPDETAESFAGGRFHTGDIGYMDADGYIFIIDRKKDLILSGGFNVYPRNIEDAIYEHPDVAEVTVIGVPDDYRGQSAKAFVKLKDGARPFTLEELRQFLGDKLGRHELPAELELRAELPKTPVGKLSKKELIVEETAKREAKRSTA